MAEHIMQCADVLGSETAEPLLLVTNVADADASQRRVRPNRVSDHWLLWLATDDKVAGRLNLSMAEVAAITHGAVEQAEDPTSVTRPARRHHCNHSAMAGFAEAH